MCMHAQVEAMQAALASQINQIRQQVASAVYAAEEVARSTEAAAGVRLSRLAVRMQELNKQARRSSQAGMRCLSSSRNMAAPDVRLLMLEGHGLLPAGCAITVGEAAGRSGGGGGGLGAAAALPAAGSGRGGRCGSAAQAGGTGRGGARQGTVQ